MVTIKKNQKAVSSYPYGNLKQNLKKLMKEARVDIETLAEQTGVSTPNIKRMRTEDNLNPTIASLSPIADFFGITVDELIGKQPFPANRISGSFMENESHWTQVPLLTWKQITQWPMDKTKSKSFIKTDLKVSENAFALTVTPKDWEGFLKKAHVIIEPNHTPRHRDYVLVQQDQETPTLRQLLIDEDYIYLMPLNKMSDARVMDKRYRIIGVVVQIKMDLVKS